MHDYTQFTENTHIHIAALNYRTPNRESIFIEAPCTRIRKKDKSSRPIENDNRLCLEPREMNSSPEASLLV